MGPAGERCALVTGATGFVGRALLPALRARGDRVVAASRRPHHRATDADGVAWRTCDVSRWETLGPALEGVQIAFFLVHSLAAPQDYRALERRAARAFAVAAAEQGVSRIIYLGGPAPHRRPSKHLLSRLAVGEILRAGEVPAIELRASMIVGAGSASWQLACDLARLPAIPLPRWLQHRMRPVALEDVVASLLGAMDLPLGQQAWFDIPGPDTLSVREMLERIAALRGHRLRTLPVPFLPPQLCAPWLKWLTGTELSVARELLLGLAEDRLPDDDRFWDLIGRRTLISFDEAARRALQTEPTPGAFESRA